MDLIPAITPSRNSSNLLQPKPGAKPQAANGENSADTFSFQRTPQNHPLFGTKRKSKHPDVEIRRRKLNPGHSVQTRLKPTFPVGSTQIYPLLGGVLGGSVSFLIRDIATGHNATTALGITGSVLTIRLCEVLFMHRKGKQDWETLFSTLKEEYRTLEPEDFELVYNKAFGYHEIWVSIPTVPGSPREIPLGKERSVHVHFRQKKAEE